MASSDKTAKPWEETWEPDPDDCYGSKIAVRSLTGRTVNGYAGFPPFSDERKHIAHHAARARLAAAAPEMARLLLELEWDHAECNICGGCKVHEPDCKLVAVLTRAGVLP